MPHKRVRIRFYVTGKSCALQWQGRHGVGTAFISGSRKLGLFVHISEDQEAERERNASAPLIFLLHAFVFSSGSQP